MSFEEDLAASVRAALAGAGAVREVRMFGGIGFMLNGNMLVAASRRGLLARVGKDQQRDALARPGARQMVMRDRAMEGYVYVDPPVITSAAAVKSWVQLALAFVQTLPAKAAGTRPATKRHAGAAAKRSTKTRKSAPPAASKRSGAKTRATKARRK